MTLFKFTEAILTGEPIPVLNHGKHRWDFTYIDDMVEGIIRSHLTTPHGRAISQLLAPAQPPGVYNIGNNQLATTVEDGIKYVVAWYSDCFKADVKHDSK
jgi:UDP-glucuronate 4-epimerase